MPRSPITRPTYMGSFASSAKSMFAMLLPLWPTPGPAADIRAFSDTINDVYEEDLRGRQGLMLELPRQQACMELPHLALLADSCKREAGP